MTLMAACRDRIPTIEVETDKTAAVKENMINANRVVIQSEATQIESYIQRRGWSVHQLPSGAFFYPYTQGNGSAILTNDKVRVTYRLEGLDGTPFYTNQVDTLVVGHRDVTAALDELLQQLHYGSQAYLIAPSNSAYGVVGDGDRVPSRTVVIYNVNNIQKL
jgi:FKBP-type peptidyl-prolyl cis-trans isomerase